MIQLFRKDDTLFAVQTAAALDRTAIDKLCWLFGDAEWLDVSSVSGIFVGPRREMITPWSTNAVEITQNMGIDGIVRIEEFRMVDSEAAPYDKMLYRMYRTIDGDVFTIDKQPEPIVHIEDIEAYNKEQGLALNPDEIQYLKDLAVRIGRPLTDSEVFGFSQVNSEHCRHKIFNGQFVIDGETKPETLFKLIKKTTTTNPGRVVSAYKDNCAFLQGAVVEQFAPASHEGPDYFETEDFESVISIKAETHNFPTTVEPFNGPSRWPGRLAI